MNIGAMVVSQRRTKTRYEEFEPSIQNLFTTDAVGSSSCSGGGLASRSVIRADMWW
jgi:hypothetical protein